MLIKNVSHHLSKLTFLISGLALINLGLSSCSSLMGRYPQDIVVNTSPIGASCVVSKIDKKITDIKSTPVHIQIIPTEEGLNFLCRKEGYLNTQYSIMPSGSFLSGLHFQPDLMIELIPIPPSDLTYNGYEIGDPILASSSETGLREEKNIILRFQILRILVDQKIIDRKDYIARRSANLGSLLPYSAPPASIDLSLPPPPPEHLLDRLHFLMDMSSKDVIPKDDREKEKQTILEMLLPEKPKKLVEKTTPIKDRFQAAIAIGRLDRFLRAKVITEEEMAREKSIILKQAEEAVSASERAAKISLGLKSNDKDDPVKENSKSYWIDLGSSQNKKSIEEKWVSLKLQFVELFNGLDHKVTKTTQRRVGLSYHLKVGPFKDLIKPKLMCDQLTKQNIVCSIDKKMS